MNSLQKLGRGEVVFTSDDKNKSSNCSVWDAKTGNLLHNFKQGNSSPRCLSLIGDDYLISGLKGTNFLYIWRLVRGLGAPIKIPCVGKIAALAVSPNGIYCVGAIGSKLYLWQVSTGQLFCVLPKHYQPVTCIKFTDDGKYFVSGGVDGNVMAWNFFELLDFARTMPGEDYSLKPMWTQVLDGDVVDIHVGHFGLEARVVALGSDQTCKVYDMFTGKSMFTILPDDFHPTSVTMDPAECFIFLGAKSGDIIKITLFDWIEEKSLSVSMKNHEEVFAGHSDAVTCLSVSSDGQLLGSGSNDGTAKLWSIYNATVLHILKHSGPVTNIFFEWYPRAMDDLKMPPKIIVKPFKFEISSSINEIIESRLQGHPLSMSTSRVDKRYCDLFKQGKGAISLKRKNECKEVVGKLAKQNTQLYSECQNTVLYDMPYTYFE